MARVDTTGSQYRSVHGQSEKDAAEKLNNDPQRWWTEEGGDKGEGNEKSSRARFALLKAEVTLEAAMDGEDVEALAEARLFASGRKLDHPELLSRAAAREEYLRSTKELIDTLNNVEELLKVQNMDALSSEEKVRRLDVQLLELEKGVQRAVSAGVHEDHLAKGEQKVTELRARGLLARAIYDEEVNAIESLIDDCRHKGVDEETLQAAEERRICISAEIMLAEASLGDLKEAKGDEDPEALLMHFSEAHVQKLRTAYEVADIAHVPKEKLEVAKELLRQVEGRVRLEKAMNGEDPRELHLALLNAQDLRLPGQLLEEGARCRHALDIKKRLDDACESRDLPTLWETLPESTGIGLPEEYLAEVLRTRDQLEALHEMDQAMQGYDKPRLRIVLRRAEQLGCMEAVQRGTLRLRQLDAITNLEDAMAEEDLTGIQKALHLGEELEIEGQFLEKGLHKKAQMEHHIRLHAAIGGEDSELLRTLLVVDSFEVDATLVQQAENRLRDLNLLRSLRRLLEDEKRTAAALADGLKHADEYGLMDNPIVMDARVVLARMEAHNALDEAVLNRDRIRLDKALSEAREREVPASALDTAENILRLLVLAEDIADAVEGRDLRHLEKLTAEGTEAELEPALLQVAQDRIVQLQAHEHLAGLIKDPSSTENALQQAMATAQACRVDDELLEGAQHRIDQLDAEAKLRRYMHVGVTGLAALDGAVTKAQSLGVQGEVMEASMMRQRRLRAIKGLGAAQDAGDVGMVLTALEEARAAGLEESRISQAQARLERMLAARGPQARVNLLLATEARVRSKLTAAVEQALLCGVDADLITNAEKVLEELGPDDPVEENAEKTSEGEGGEAKESGTADPLGMGA